MKSSVKNKNQQMSQSFKNNKHKIASPSMQKTQSVHKNRKSLDEPRRTRGRVAVGIHAVKEVLKVRPKAIIELHLKSGWQSHPELAELQKLAQHEKVKIIDKQDGLLDKWSSGHQGVACEVSQEPRIDVSDLQDLKEGVILFVDGVEDPHNLGALLRTSWLMGVKAIVIPQDRAVGLSPIVHKVACGGVEHVPVLVVSSFQHIIEDLKKSGWWVYGLSGEGKSTIYQQELNNKTIWIVGAEDRGIRVTTSRLCDELVQIPQLDPDASYNASVAAGIALSETFRQFSQKKLIK